MCDMMNAPCVVDKGHTLWIWISAPSMNTTPQWRAQTCFCRGSMINLSKARSFGAAPAQGIFVSIKMLTPQVERVTEVWLAAPEGRHSAFERLASASLCLVLCCGLFSDVGFNPSWGYKYNTSSTLLAHTCLLVFGRGHVSSRFYSHKVKASLDVLDSSTSPLLGSSFAWGRAFVLCRFRDRSCRAHVIWMQCTSASFRAVSSFEGPRCSNLSPPAQICSYYASWGGVGDGGYQLLCCLV